MGRQRRRVSINWGLKQTEVRIIEEMEEGDDCIKKLGSNKYKVKRKTRNNQNKRDVMNELFLLCSLIRFFYLHTLQLKLSCLIIKQFHSGHANSKHGGHKIQYSVWCPTMDPFIPLINQTENAKSKKIKIRIYKF
jgi:hypothetical protein